MYMVFALTLPGVGSALSTLLGVHCLNSATYCHLEIVVNICGSQRVCLVQCKL